jgi:hypothetical protein
MNSRAAKFFYRAVLDRACARLAEATGIDDLDDDAIPALMSAASSDPDGFRLLFRYAARRGSSRTCRRSTTQRYLRELSPGRKADVIEVSDENAFIVRLVATCRA